ncbi:MAG TPA: SpoIIE family protein phosphatase [Candidatus Acidoferrales bacterium]|nr:SpoIIE family protein phosphatase [Candidatus Acidoferrales bacterium]
MFAPYVLYISRIATPGFVRIVQGDRLEMNAAGRRLLEQPTARAAFEEALDEAQHTELAVERRIGDTVLSFLPMYDSKDNIEAVVACKASLAQMPRLLNELHSGTWHFSEIMHLLPQVVLTARPSGSFDFASRRWYELTQTELSVGNLDQAVVNAVDASERPQFRKRWNEGTQARMPFSFEFVLHTHAGDRWYELRATPWRHAGRIIKWIVALIDVTEAVHARDELASSRSRLQFLVEAGRLLDHSLDPALIAQRVAELARLRVGGTFLVVLDHDPLDESDLPACVGADPPAGQSLVPQIREAMEAAGGRCFVEYREPAGGLRWLIAIPFRGREFARGFIALANADCPAPHGMDEYETLGELAGRLASAMENILAYRRERATSELLQRAMLPVALPQVPGLYFDVAYEPAEREALVGGDWYDAFLLNDGRVAFAVGDVGGHGFAAAVVMGRVRQAMRTAALEDPDPAHVLARANRLLSTEPSPLVTAFFGVLDPLTLRMECASAGHPYPLLVDGDARVFALPLRGVPLGVREDHVATPQTIDLPAGGALVLYTDGLVEVERNMVAGEAYLHEHLARWASEGFMTGAQELQAKVLRYRRPGDDAAMLIVRVPELDDVDFTMPAEPRSAKRGRQAVQRFLRGSQFDERRRSGFALAVSEAVNNAIEHAYGDREDGVIHLRLRKEGGSVRAAIADRGQWRESQSHDRGRGLFIMRELTNGVDIERTNEGTEVRLHLDLRRSAAAYASPLKT